MKKRLPMVLLISGLLTQANAEPGAYRTYLSPAHPVEMKGGIISHEHFLTFNYKKKVDQPARPLLEAENSIPMWDNFIVGLEPKNEAPIDPNEAQWAQYELDRPAPAGKCIVFLFLWNFRYAEKSTSKLSVEVDGKVVSYDFPFVDGPYKGHGYKWIPFEFVTDKPVTGFTVKLTPPPDAPFIIKHMFVSNQPEDIAKFEKSGDYGAFTMKETSPFASKAEAPTENKPTSVSPNLVLGSDFETGFGFGWRSLTYNFLYNERTYGNSAGHESPHCLAPEGAMGNFKSMSLLSNPFKVKEAGTYVLSFYARAADTNHAKLGTELRTNPKFYLGADKEHSFKDELTGEWKRYSHTAQLAKGNVAVGVHLDEGVQVDRLQLEKDELRPYSQALDLELGALFKGRYTRVYRTNEKIPARLMVCARDKSLKQAEFWAEVVDYHGKTVMRKDLKAELSNGAGQVELDLQNGRPGTYRLQLGPKGAKDFIAEIIFTNHFPEEDYQKGLPSAVGFYSALSHSALQTLQLSGMNHAITFSCYPQTGHWGVVGKGPTAKDVIFYDEYVDLCKLYDIELTVNVDYRNAAMKWLKTREGSKIMPADMNDWRVFLETLMGHYGDRVKGWLILDDLAHYFSPADYKEFVDIAVEVHKKVVPNSKLIAWVYNQASCYFKMEFSKEDEEKYGNYFSEITDVLFMADAKWSRKFKGKKEIRRYFFGGAGDDMYRKSISKKTFVDGVSRDPLLYMASTPPTMKRAIKQFADYEIDRFQYYSARTPPDQMSIFHFDGTLTPGGHAFSVLNHLMKGKRFYRNHALPGLEINEFRDPQGRSFVSLWSRSGDPIELFLPAKPSELEICDLVGTPVVAEPADGGLKLLVGNEILYLKSGKTEFKTLLAGNRLNNIAPFRLFLAPGEDDRHLQLLVGLRNRTEKPLPLMMHFSPVGINWNTGQGDFHDDLVAPMKNFDKILKPGEQEMLYFPVRYVPQQEYVLRGLDITMNWMGAENNVSRELKASYASKIPDKAAPDANVKPLLAKNRFNRIMCIDLSVHYPGGKNKADIMCFPRWDSKNLYFTARILAEGYVLGNPRNTLKLFLDPKPMENWTRAEGQKDYVVAKVDLNTGTAALSKNGVEKKLQCKMDKTDKELVVEWAVPWSELDAQPPVEGKLAVIGLNFNYLTASAAEEFFYPWMEWTDRVSDVPDSTGYLIVGP